MENALKSDPLVYQFIIVIIIDFEYCQVYHVTIRQHILGLARGPVMMNWCLMSSDVMRHIRDKFVTNAEARCNKSLRPRKPEGSLGRTAQDVHLSRLSHSSWTMRGPMAKNNKT